MSNLTILNTSIRTFENLYSLTDLHRVSGGESKHKPTFFLRNDQTKDLIAEIEQESKLQNCNSVKVLHGGLNSGTYACEELALAYATWISPKFHLVVLRAFIAMHKGEVKNQQLALPEPEPKYLFEITEHDLRNLIWLWFGHKQMNTLLGQLEPALEAIGSNLHPMVYSYHREYANQHKQALEIMREFIKPFKQNNDLDWQRLQHHLDNAYREQAKITSKPKRLPYNNF